MSLRKTENQVKDLLTETIITLCRNTLNNYPDVSVEGLLGVTLNKQEIFLVSINQQIDNRKSQSEGLSGLISEIYNAKRKRRQNERSDGESESSDNEAHDNAELKLESNDAGGAPVVKRKRRRKRKHFSNSNSPTNFNVISDCANSNGVAQERSGTSHHSQRQDLNNLGDSNNQGQSLEALGFAEIQKTSFLSSSNFEQDNADNLDAIDDVLSRELNDASEQLARLNKHQNDEECDSEIPHDITPHSPNHPGVSGVASNQIEPNENDSLGSIHPIVNVKIKTEKPDPEDSENEENPSNVIIKVEKRDTDGWPSLGEGSSGLANETIDDHGDSDGSLHDGMGDDEAVPSSSNSEMAEGGTWADEMEKKNTALSHSESDDDPNNSTSESTALTELFTDPNNAQNIDANEVKRKRGRPRKSENAENAQAKDKEKEIIAKDKEIATLRKMLTEKDDEVDRLIGELKRSTKRKDAIDQELETTREVNKELLEEISEKNKELKTVREMLKDREADYSELLDQIANQSDTSIASPKPKGLLLCDKITKSSLQHLSVEIEWDHKLLPISEFESLDSATIDSYELIMVLTGVDEINDGTLGNQCFKTATVALERWSKLSHVIVISLPPSVANTQINVYNLKLEQFLKANNLERIQFIDWNARLTPRSELLHMDGINMSDKGIELMCTTVNRDLVVPSIKSKCMQTTGQASSTDTANLSKQPTKCIAEIPKGLIGKLIGRNGRNIRKISETHNTKIDIGQWVVPKRDSREDVTEAISALRGKCDVTVDGVVVSGTIGNVHTALKEIHHITRSDEPPEKKAKF